MSVPADASDDNLLAAVDYILQSSGAQRLPEGLLENWSPIAAAYEDPLALVGVSLYESFAALEDGWLDAQERLATLISSTITNIGPKAWDGYLVLLTTQKVASADVAAVTAIRSNTKRLRKLVITGDELGDDLSVLGITPYVRRGLAPLLPLELPEASIFTNPLTTLPSRLRVPGLTADDISAVVSSYEDGLPMIAGLHERLTSRGTL